MRIRSETEYRVARGHCARRCGVHSGRTQPRHIRRIGNPLHRCHIDDSVRGHGPPGRGNLATVESLVPANGDVHTFSPKPSDVARLARARLVVMNGLGLDDWLDKLVNSAAPNATVLKLAVGLPDATYVTGTTRAVRRTHTSG